MKEVSVGARLRKLQGNQIHIASDNNMEEVYLIPTHVYGEVFASFSEYWALFEKTSLK